MANDLKIKITADGVSEVEKNLEKVADSLGDVSGASGKAETSMKNLGNSFDKQKISANALAVALGTIVANLGMKFVGSMKEFGAEVLKEADNFRKLGESIGMTAADVAGFDRSISQAGGSAEAFQMAMQGVANALDPEKPSEQRQALEKLGVSLRDANGLYVSQKEALFRISDAFAKETDTVKKSNIAREAFGKAGKEMIVFLNQGREELEKQVKAYGDASGYTDEYARSVEELNSSLANAEIAAKGALVALTNSEMFKGAIKWVSDLSSEWVKFLGELKIKKAIDDSAALNNQMGKYADKVAEIELKKAKGENKGYFKTDLDDLKKGLPELEAGASRLIGIQNALNKAKSEGANDNVIRKLNEEFEAVKQGNKLIREQKALDAKAAAEAAEDEMKRKKAAQKEIDDAPKKKEAAERYANEMKALGNWLENYKKSKMTETQIAEAAHDEQKRKLNDLLTAQKISYDEFSEYMADSEADLNLKLNQIRESAHAEAMAMEQSRYNEWVAQQEEKNRKIEEEKAKEKELQETLWQLREASAIDEEERLNIQRERMNARYDEQAAKAKENAALLNEIEAARIAEAERLENQLLQTRISTASQYASSLGQVAKGAATLGKASGNTMKGIAITEAMINTALAATKAMTSAPWPLSLALQAGAIASGMAQVAAIKAQKFAEGGVVGGNSYYGDHVPVRANSGEMIINKEQQRKLFEMANGESQGGGKQIVVNFSPQIPQGINSSDLKKWFRENTSFVDSLLADRLSKGLTSAGVFA